MTGNDAELVVTGGVTGGVASGFENPSSKVFEDGSEVIVVVVMVDTF